MPKKRSRKRDSSSSDNDRDSDEDWVPNKRSKKAKKTRVSKVSKDNSEDKVSVVAENSKPTTHPKQDYNVATSPSRPPAPSDREVITPHLGPYGVVPFPNTSPLGMAQFSMGVNPNPTPQMTVNAASCITLPNHYSLDMPQPAGGGLHTWPEIHAPSPYRQEIIDMAVSLMGLLGQVSLDDKKSALVYDKLEGILFQVLVPGPLFDSRFNGPYNASHSNNPSVETQAVIDQVLARVEFLKQSIAWRQRTLESSGILKKSIPRVHKEPELKQIIARTQIRGLKRIIEALEVIEAAEDAMFAEAGGAGRAGVGGLLPARSNINTDFLPVEPPYQFDWESLQLLEELSRSQDAILRHLFQNTNDIQEPTTPSRVNELEGIPLFEDWRLDVPPDEVPETPSQKDTKEIEEWERVSRLNLEIEAAEGERRILEFLERNRSSL